MVSNRIGSKRGRAPRHPSTCDPSGLPPEKVNEEACGQVAHCVEVRLLQINALASVRCGSNAVALDAPATQPEFAAAPPCPPQRSSSCVAFMLLVVMLRLAHKIPDRLRHRFPQKIALHLYPRQRSAHSADLYLLGAHDLRVNFFELALALCVDPVEQRLIHRTQRFRRRSDALPTPYQPRGFLLDPGV